MFHFPHINPKPDKMITEPITCSLDAFLILSLKSLIICFKSFLSSSIIPTSLIDRLKLVVLLEIVVFVRLTTYSTVESDVILPPLPPPILVADVIAGTENKNVSDVFALLATSQHLTDQL